MKTLILTPYKRLQCGMYQLAKDLAKEFNGDIGTKHGSGIECKEYYNGKDYDEVITFLYPMHNFGKMMKRKFGTKWICYDQKIPPVTKQYFPNFWRRQAMKYINWRNNTTMKGADEYWDVTEREQKPRWNEKHKWIVDLKTDMYENIDLIKPYALYLGRTTDYKNYGWLQKTMKELNIPLLHPEDVHDNAIHLFLSHTKMLVTASIWEGFGRPVMEAETLGIPAVAYDVGAHKRHIKKGICVPLDINNMEKSEEKFKETILKVYNQNLSKRS